MSNPRIVLPFICACACVAGFARASEFPIELPAADGSTLQPLELIASTHSKAAVFFFYLHDCPICNSYAPEIERIRSAYQPKGFAFYVVQTDPKLTAEKALAHAREYSLKGTILLDASNQLAQKCGATVTPEAAVVGANGKILYMGRIDDLYADFGRRRPEASVHDLRAALDAIAAGKPAPPAAGPAVGCFIPIVKK